MALGVELDPEPPGDLPVRLQAQRFFHKVRDEFRLLAEMLLKVLMVRQEAHGAA